MSQENVEVMRHLFDAVARRDTETVLSLYDPDVEWDGSRHRWGEVLGGEPIWRGHDGLRKWARAYYETWDDLQNTVEELLDAGDRVVAIVTTRARGRASGVSVEWAHHAGVWTVRDGRIVRVVWFRTRDEALESVGLRE
jgi:ketosteroid isomerase-like protein